MPRRLNEQVVVITGASSGVGRLAALKFGQAGASVVLAARNDTALNEVMREINEAGGRAIAVPTDVGSWEQVQRLADTAAAEFGRLDTWVNDAAVSVYASVEETTIAEYEQVTRINYLGQVHGVKAALRYMKGQGYGTIINIGSVESQRSLPLQSAYAASKHAVKGFTEALRLEMQRDYPDIHVTIIFPAGMNTPLFNHARSKLDVMPMPVPPIYKPDPCADAIVYAAEHPQRDIYIGGAGWFFSVMERLSPALFDRIMLPGGIMWKLQQTNAPDDHRDNLFTPSQGTGRVEGDFSKWAKPSLYTRLVEIAPLWQKLTLPLLLVAAVGVLRRR